MADAVTFLASPVDITPTKDGLWHLVDVSAHVSNCSGVIMRAWRGHVSSPLLYGARAPGAIAPIEGDLYGFNHVIFHAGVDASNNVELMVDSTGAIATIELIGYFDDTHCVFVPDPVSEPLQIISTWTDYDISSITGADTAIAAVVMVANTSGAPQAFGIRAKGSTDNRVQTVEHQNIQGMVVGLDAGEVLQYYQMSDNTFFYVVGYIKTGVTMNVNAPQVSISTIDTWEAISGLGSGIAGAFFESVSTTDEPYHGFRPAGNAAYADHYGRFWVHHGWYCSGADNDQIDGQKSVADVQFFLNGTIDSGGAPPPLNPNPLFLGQDF